MIESVHFHFDAQLQAKLETLSAKYDALSKVHMEVVSRNVALLSENKKLRNENNNLRAITNADKHDQINAARFIKEALRKKRDVYEALYETLTKY